MRLPSWYASKGSGGQGIVADENTGRTVAVAYDVRDAPIIAQAPALAEALRELLDAPARSVPRSKRTRAAEANARYVLGLTQ